MQGTDTLDMTYDTISGLPLGVTRSGSTQTAYGWNADGTLAGRTDPVGTSNFGYDRLDQLGSASSPLYTGTAGFSWRLDGLLAGRSWPHRDSAAVSYAALKRPTKLEQRSRTADGQTDP